MKTHSDKSTDKVSGKPQEFRRRTLHGSGESAVTSAAKMVIVGNTPEDIMICPSGPPTGAKRPAEIRRRLGGTGGNGGLVAVANQVPCAVVGVQAICQLNQTQQYARDVGMTSHISVRANTRPAASVSLPDGSCGNRLYVDRMEPLTYRELTPEAREDLVRACAVIIGPMPATNGELPDICVRVARLAKRAYRVLIPHPTIVGHRDFEELVGMFDFMVFNNHEAAILAPKAKGTRAQGAQVLRVLGADASFAITAGAREGCLRIQQRWLPIVPKAVEVVDDVGCGDCFAAAWTVAHGVLGAGPEAARDYAVKIAAEALSQHAWHRVFSPY